MNLKFYRKMAMAAAAMLTAVTANASPFTTFPPLQKETDQPQQKAVQRVSPNLDKEAGVKMFASTSSDGTMFNSWVSFSANNMYDITRHFSWIDCTDMDEVYRVNLVPASGAYNTDDSKYYTMVTMVYDCIWNAKNTFNYCPVGWYVVDVNTGTAKLLQDMKPLCEEKGWYKYSLDPNAPHWGMWMDMAFDPVDGTMYAMAQSEQTITEDNPFHSALVVVNLEDGTYRVRKELPGKYYLGLTFDLDGNMYAARWEENNKGSLVGAVIVQLDRRTFEETRTVASLQKDGVDFKLCYNGTLDVDRTTGDLYYAGCDVDGGRQSLFRINPKTGDNECLGSFSYDNIVGLHIPYQTAAASSAPARVSDLKTSINPENVNELTLTWTNPSTQWNLEDLTSFTGVKIYRDSKDGQPIADLTEDMTAGAEASFVDNTATQGLHTYYLIPYNESGDGIEDYIAAFVGRDVPDAPTDIYVQSSGPTAVYVSWSAPKTGAQDGWFDESSLKYTVVRYPDGAVVAENTTDTYVLDTDFEGKPMMEVYYTVTASNVDGTGLSADTDPVIAGSAYAAPWSFDFMDETAKSAFTGYCPDNEYYSLWQKSYWQSQWEAYMENVSKANDYLLTPHIELKAGHTYRTRWNVMFSRNENIHNFEFTCGKEKTAESQKVYATEEFNETYEGVYDQKKEFSHIFTVEEDGNYYLGLHLISEGISYDYVSVTSMEVEEVFENDLKAASVEGFPKLNRDKEQTFWVSVYNSGSKAQDTYKVQTGYKTRRGEFVAFGETDKVPALQPDETAVVEVPALSEYESGLSIDLCARVVLDNDQYEGNDISETMTVSTEESDGGGYNLRVTGTEKSAGEYGDSNVPFGTYSPYYTSVSIYPYKYFSVSDTDDETVESIEISRIGYVGTSRIEMNGNLTMQVYIGETEDAQFVGSPCSNIINPESLTKVFDGSVLGMSMGFDGVAVTLDEPYTFKPGDGKNLVVAVSTYCPFGNGQFLLNWNTWDKDRATRSLKYNGSAPGWSDSVYPYGGAPELHLSANISKTSGIEYVADEAGDAIRVAGNTVYTGSGARSITVSDLAGRTVMNSALQGAGSVTLDVIPGIYVISVKGADGKSQVVKAVIR